ncbi:MAG TPA: response regulator [Rhizomicrobium sp.]|nr:response regulator [Rhizomicrobium sp.]
MSRLTFRSTPLQILFAEADTAEHRLLGATCQLIEAEPLFSTCGMQAVKMFRTLMIDVVVINLNLPSGDGFDALSNIRLSGRRGYNAPVIAMTENVTGLPEAAYKRLGFTGLYIRPIEPYRLIERLDAALICTGNAPIFKLRVSG